MKYQIPSYFCFFISKCTPNIKRSFVSKFVCLQVKMSKKYIVDVQHQHSRTSFLICLLLQKNSCTSSGLLLLPMSWFEIKIVTFIWIPLFSLYEELLLTRVSHPKHKHFVNCHIGIAMPQKIQVKLKSCRKSGSSFHRSRVRISRNSDSDSDSSQKDSVSDSDSTNGDSWLGRKSGRDRQRDRHFFRFPTFIHSS